MTKAELIATVAEKLEVSKKEAGDIIKTVVDTITEGAVAGECVVPGLGKIVSADTPARSGVSKLSGEDKPWSVPAGKTLKLRLSKEGKALN